MGDDSPLRAGWLLLRPSLEDFNSLQLLVETGKFDEQRGWNSLDLPVDYPGWSNPAKTAAWGFYGAQLEQGKSISV